MSAEEEIVMIVCIYDKKLKRREKKKKAAQFPPRSKWHLKSRIAPNLTKHCISNCQHKKWQTVAIAELLQI